MKSINSSLRASRLVCALLVVSFMMLPCNRIVAVQGKLSVEKEELSLRLEESQTSKQDIKIINLTNSDIFFSAYKLAEDSRPYQHALSAINNADTTEELGSGWYTTQQNYERTGYNLPESSVPPYAYKWQYQADKVLFSPVVSGRNLYIPSENGNVYWIDSRTGVNKDLFSISSNLTTINIHKKYLILTSTSEIFVYDRIQMTILWKANCDFSNPYSVVAEGDNLYYANGNSLILCNITNGNPEWEIAGGYKRVSIFGTKLFAVTDKNAVVCMNKTTGSVDWQLPLQKNIIGSPSCMANSLYITLTAPADNKSEILCIGVDGKSRWSYLADGLAMAPVSVNEDAVFCPLNNGQVLSLNQIDGKILWKQDIKNPIYVPVALTSTHAFIGTNDGTIYALNIQTGEIVWKTSAKFPISSPLVVAQGFIYAANNSGTMIAFGREWENVVPPMPPDRLKGFPGNGSVTLAWRAQMLEPDLAGYHVYRRSLYEKDFGFIKNLLFVNNFQDLNVKNGNPYDYIIRSYDTYGNESTTSNMVSVTPTEKADPGWLVFDPTSGLIPSGKEITMSVSINTFSLPPGLYSGSINIFHTGDMESEQAIAIKVKLEVLRRVSDKPGKPSFTSINASDTSVKLAWLRDLNIKSYELYRSTVSKDEYHLLTTLTGDSNVYLDQTVANGKQYFYQLKGIDKNGKESDFSDEVSITPKPLPIQVQYQNGTVFTKPVIQLTGKVDPKATLLIKNVSIPVMVDGSFDTMIGLTVGDNQIPVIAQDTDKNQQEYALKLVFKTSELLIHLQINSKLVLVNDLKWPYLLEAPPLIQDGRTFVPVRFISEVIGASVTWDPQEKKVTILKNNTKIELWLDRKSVRVNGTESIIDAAPFVSNGRTLVPLRFIVEPLGAAINWNKFEQTIDLDFKF
jgi:outer membrane protein assembly factor BamB